MQHDPYIIWDEGNDKWVSRRDGRRRIFSSFDDAMRFTEWRENRHRNLIPISLAAQAQTEAVSS